VNLTFEQEQMVSEQTTPNVQSEPSTLKSAIEAAKAGRRQEAHQLLQQVVSTDPSNEVAWFWLAGVTDQPDEVLAALKRVQELNPDHPRLEAARRWAEAQLSPATGHSQDDEPALSGPASPARRTQPVHPSARTSQHNTHAVKPVPKLLRSVLSFPATWPWPLQVGLLGLAALLLVGGLIWVIWWQVDAAQARLSVPPTPDNAARVLALQPELNTALTESRWEDAVAVLEVMRALDPQNPALQRELAEVYYQVSQRRRDQGDLEGALAALDQSLALVPDEPQVQKERGWLDAYLQGVGYHQAGDWEATIRSLALVHREAPTYLDVTELLYSAYYNLALSQQAAGDLVGAQASYQAALELMPQEPLAREKADEVAVLLQPPTPTAVPTLVPTPTPTPVPNPQRIVVDVSEQRMYVYEGDNLLWDWVTSTGEPGRDTAYGQFAVQSKIPVAYASTWNLDMPYWLGIYWSGPLENGIHALPIQRATGYKLWDGFLGQRVSYGCVILSDENAKTLYDWVKIGTPVTIQP
jgi:tetratricopeptide (TPR) repeat protein